MKPASLLQWRGLQRLWPLAPRQRQRARLHAPLLSKADIAALRNLAGRPQDPLQPHLVQRRPAGEYPSPFRGSGLDYEDSRAYQPGDDLRFMHWRLTARTGEAYMKQFREERRPNRFIMVDRRAAMRFGTRTRLKVTQAAQAVVLYTYAALARNWSVGGLVFESKIRWVENFHGQQNALALVDASVAPCPPGTAADPQPAFGFALKLLLERLTPGASLILISDFADLQTGDLPALLQLTARHDVQALQVLDPAELDLPDAGRLRLEDPAGQRRVIADTGQADFRHRFHDTAKAHYEQRRHILMQARIGVHVLFTDQDIGQHLDWN